MLYNSNTNTFDYGPGGNPGQANPNLKSIAQQVAALPPDLRSLYEAYSPTDMRYGKLVTGKSSGFENDAIANNSLYGNGTNAYASALENSPDRQALISALNAAGYKDLANSLPLPNSNPSSANNFNPFLAASVLALPFAGEALGLGAAGDAAAGTDIAAGANTFGALGGAGAAGAAAPAAAATGTGLSGILGGGTLGNIGAGALEGAGIGGVTSGVTGGNILKGALTGGITGGAAGGLSSLLSGASGIGNSLGITGPNSLLGTSAGTPLAGSVGPTAGSGILGAVTKGASSLGLGSLLGTGASAGGGSSSFGPLATALGGAYSLYSNDQAKKDLVDSQNKAIGALQPYLNTGGAATSKLSDLLGTSSNTGATGYGSLTTPFTPGDLTQDPGYQFNLAQGTRALNAKESASGNLFSGAALKEAQTFGQGLADNTYNNAFQRDLAQKQAAYGDISGAANTGLSAAGGAANAYTNTGNAQANSQIATSNIINSSLSSLLNGSGAKRPVNIGGQVVYI